MEAKEILTNKRGGGTPRITVLTPVFNRRFELQRCMDSVRKQTYQDLEYIIVNDGSTEDIDDVVRAFMDAVPFSVTYIKKDNGGVHTARNLGIRYARGEMLALLDSDDELVPNAMERFISVWDGLPRGGRYREVVCNCVDQNGELVGELFPDNINDVSPDERHRMIFEAKGDKFALGVTKILQENPWPEPEGITFVTEGVIWSKLDREYDSYFINDALLIYHMETEESYSNRSGHRRSLQQVKNSKWNYAFMLDHSDQFGLDRRQTAVLCLKYCIFDKVLLLSKKPYSVKVSPVKYKLLCAALYLPSFVGAFVYMKKRM